MSDSQETMTIIIPVKNRPLLITRCLDSIKAQTWRPIRIIVVDNGSTDDTPQRVAEWARINGTPDLQTDLISEPTPGQAAARRRGIDETRSRLVMHFDSDDTMRPDSVAHAVEALDPTRPDPAELYLFRVMRHFPDGSSSVSRDTAISGLLDRQLVHCPVATQNFAATTELVRRAGSWDSSLRCWEDWELGVRLILNARKTVASQYIGADLICHAHSVTGTEHHSRLGLWEEAIDRVEQNLQNASGRTLRYVAYRRTILAAHYARELRTLQSNRPTDISLAETRLLDSHIRSVRAGSAELLRKAFNAPCINPLQRLYLRAAYLYTSLGGRGAAIPAPLFF